MRIQKIIHTTICCLAIPGLLLPWRPASAAEPADTAQVAPARIPPVHNPPQFKIVDVSLGQNGLLRGQVLDRRGQGIANAAVTVVNETTTVSQVTTDQRGFFQIEGLRGGVYQLVTPNGQQACRLWHGATAPPSARAGVQLIADSELVAGQYSPMRCCLTSPLVVAGIAAIAIAVPIAINNSRNDNRRAVPSGS